MAVKMPSERGESGVVEGRDGEMPCHYGRGVFTEREEARGEERIAMNASMEKRRVRHR